MKKHSILCAMALILIMALAPAAYAAAPSSACYPVSTTRNEDGTEIRKVYDLSPEEDPAGIARSDFEQEGFHYTLVDLLRQESPEYEERIHTETVSIPSKNKDMESVLALLPTQREFVTEDGLSGTLTLQNISWQTDNTANLDEYAVGDRYTAVATYTGSATSSYVKGYTVTADYSGTVSRIALNKTRYVAIFEGTPLKPVIIEPDPEAQPSQSKFNWPLLLVPLGVVAAGGAGIGATLFVKHRRENMEESE